VLTKVGRLFRNSNLDIGIRQTSWNLVIYLEVVCVPVSWPNYWNSHKPVVHGIPLSSSGANSRVQQKAL